tara:strand:- start:2023 stop:2796 length:774 start_codon:yes stop_codon:yes gene_type:complete
MSRILLNNILLGEFKGFLFDKDGTLSNSESHLIELADFRVKEAESKFKEQINMTELKELKYLLKSIYGISCNGLNPHGGIAIASRYENLISTATAICLIINNWSVSIDLANEIFLNADKRFEKESNHFHQRSLLPGVRNLLERLESGSIKCGIISNDTNKGIRDFLIKNNLENKFVGYWSCENLLRKPDPNAIKEFCKILNLQPSECVLAGDSDSDLRMARQAGIGMTIGYISGWKTAPNLNFHQKLISNWDDITCL